MIGTINYLNVTALIPARGGSKGIPGKNIKNFEGKPLISHTIEYALSSKHLINNIIVSTDDDQIAAVSKASGAEIIERPKHLATDIATTESVIEHAISLIEPQPDIIILLQYRLLLKDLHLHLKNLHNLLKLTRTIIML